VAKLSDEFHEQTVPKKIWRVTYRTKASQQDSVSCHNFCGEKYLLTYYPFAGGVVLANRVKYFALMPVLIGCNL
jgi:hypothetical protein